MNGKKKSICWITSDYFIDVDIGIVRRLSSRYRIQWNVIYSYSRSRLNPRSLEAIESQENIHINHIGLKYRLRDVRSILFFFQILSKIREMNADVVYINFVGVPYFVLVAALLLRRSNTIVAAHQAVVHEGNEYKSILKLYLRCCYSWFDAFNLFSITQANIFSHLYPSKKVFITPLALEEFGGSSKKRINDPQ